MLSHRLKDVMQKAGISNANVSKLQDASVNAQERTQLMTSMMNSLSTQQKTQLRDQIHKDNQEFNAQALKYRNQVHQQVQNSSNYYLNKLEDFRLRGGKFI